MKTIPLNYDVKINGVIYPLVLDPAHQHPPEVHRHLGTDTVEGEPSEKILRRLMNACDLVHWFEDGTYIGRNAFGIGVQGQEDRWQSN